MLYIIFSLIVFAILIFEIPFIFFVSISVDKMLIEYFISLPIKNQGYAYLKDGNVVFEKRKNQNSKSVNIFEIAKEKAIVKSLLIRGVFSASDISVAMWESVAVSNLASVALNIAHQNNPFAKLSWSQHIAEDETTNIFIQSTLWLSIFDILQIVAEIGIKKLFQAKAR